MLCTYPRPNTLERPTRSGLDVYTLKDTYHFDTTAEAAVHVRAPHVFFDQNRNSLALMVMTYTAVYRVFEPESAVSWSLALH